MQPSSSTWMFLCIVVAVVLVHAHEATTDDAHTDNTASNSSSFEENVITTTDDDDDDDSEQELSSQLHDIDVRANGWTSWSEWSPCSRSCNGGVSHQIRRCQLAKCRGDRLRNKICNMQPCPDPHDFREDQCADFNSQPYEGVHYVWTPHYDDETPCALTCRGKPVAANRLEEEDLSNAGTAMLVVARLADRVKDGTRCRRGSLDMCIGGKCQRVGCDLRIASDKQIDECGVCGGDGTSCKRPLYHWSTTAMSFCSVTCGGGFKMSRAICFNRVSGEEVEEQLCNILQKPDAAVVACNTHNCPPKWYTMEWGACSTRCGSGSRLRQVHCVEEANNTKIRVNDSKCTAHKPRFEEVCNQIECPVWHTSPWSGCSVSCGEGVQVRSVQCRDSEDKHSELCPEDGKPATSKACSTGIQCPFHLIDNADSDDLLPGLYHTQPLIQPYPPPAPAHAERLVGEQIVPSESTFIPDEWGPCSVSCGEGVRRREVNCKIFLEFSRTIAKLPDHQCSGVKPMEVEKCHMEPCSAERLDIKDDPFRHDSVIKVAPGAPGKTYSWREQGYTHCSATCLGGVQELIVNCVRDDTQKVTSPYLCPRELKPEILIRTCNDHPCPPRWNYSDFQPCTQSCGIGIQTREVNCIHEVTQGGGNTVVVPNNMCPQPQPPDRQYCNVLDCPVRWRVSDWSKCSRTCGGGEKTRKVDCKQVMAQNHTVERAASMCPLPKPAERKPCNTKGCALDTDVPIIETSNSTFIQHDPKKKKISLKVGGAATVFHGTIIKIKCPVKRFNRTRIQWAKDHNYLPKASKKYKVSKKGALRVQNLTYRDSGVYTCVAGRSSADLTLNVRPKPGEFINSEEVQRQAGGYAKERVDFEIADRHNERDEMNPIFDDHSHERRPDLPKKPKKPKTTSRPGRLDFNSLSAWQPQTTTSRTDDKLVPASEKIPEDSQQSSSSSSSAGSRTLPHFQQLIANLQTFANSRGHRMVAAFPEDDPFAGSLNHSQHHHQYDDDEDEENAMVVLGKGLPEHLQFEWVITEWSKCSQTCGGNGLQMRATHCMVRLHNRSQGVESNLCEDAGLDTPDTIRKCGLDDCPKWITSEWSVCDESKCFALHRALQRRDVQCIMPGNVTLPNERCNPRDRPNNRQECTTTRCVGTWRTGPWSKCSAACDSLGVQYRILQCVWHGTKKPAGAACVDEARPSVMKSCNGLSCEAFRQECKDHSIFCPNVKAMSMCRLHRYHQQCCASCSIPD